MKNSLGLTLEEYASLFVQKKNISGYKYITDKTESTGWVELKEGSSIYGSYSSVEDALEEAWQLNLNN